MVARQVQATDPTVLDDLSTARLGTSAFRRALAAVDDAGFAAPSLLPGWSRAHLVAHVGYNARAIARLVTWAATGIETPMYASPEARAREISSGATLRPDALRSLCDHAAVDLDVRWRDLPDDRWSALVTTAQGRQVPVSETLWMRSREVWLHAVDLGSGLRLTDVPPSVTERLLADIFRTWTTRDAITDLAVVVDGPRVGPRVLGDPRTADTVVQGALAAVLGWAAGRHAGDPRDGLQWVKGQPASAPRWI
ncbi:MULTISPECIES: maleylpyruvate isomerase family mycothiol-dependent enzyme [unclassified Aeromicrobium]|uniref:maleylpyruvate isomerase family mycothiol-dependent enzyme n=1 Tax=unclassified Aeromicrobium TaxID=2633570 RepID=UPI00396B38F2